MAKRGLLNYIDSYGVDIDWNSLKNESQYVANIIEKSFVKNGSFNAKFVKRQKDCANVLRFALDKRQQTKRVWNPHYCNNRFCATCNMLKSRKAYRYMIQMMDELFWDKPDNYTVSFITVTVKNCSVEDMMSNLELLKKSSQKMVYLATRNERGKNSKFAYVRDLANGYVGSMRSCEATYNKSRNEMHPHIHIVAVFRNDIKLNVKEVAKAYKHYMGLDYLPKVQIENVFSTETKDLSENLASIARYMSKGIEVNWKSIDSIPQAVSLVEKLHEATKKKTLVSYHGYFHEGRAKAKMEEMRTTERILDEIGERETGLKDTEMEDIVVEKSTDNKKKSYYTKEDKQIIQMHLWNYGEGQLGMIIENHPMEIYKQLAERILKVKADCSETKIIKQTELNAIENGLFERIIKRAREHRKVRHEYENFHVDCIVTGVYNKYAKRFVVSKVDYFDNDGGHVETQKFDTVYDMTDCIKLYQNEMKLEMQREDCENKDCA